MLALAMPVHTGPNHHVWGRLHQTEPQPTQIFIALFRGHSGEGTPGPIPNPEVKLSSADGTARETVWESRSPRNTHCIQATLQRVA